MPTIPPHLPHRVPFLFLFPHHHVLPSPRPPARPRRHHPLAHTRPPPSSPSPSPSPSVATLSAVSAFAATRGYALRSRVVGPFVRLSLLREHSADARPIAKLSAALLPNRMHVESYTTLVREPASRLLHLSPAMLLFIAALAIARHRGAPRVYGLAIDDHPLQHRRLLRYLKRFGGRPVMRVDDTLRCVPARIFYGGFGTVVRGDVNHMLQRATAMLQRSASIDTNK